MTSINQAGQSAAIHFGAFLKSLRSRHGIRQLEVLARLPSWTQTSYSRLESGELAPSFNQLLAIYTALHEAGVELIAQDRQQFLSLARTRIEVKKSHLDHKTDQEWDALRLTLSQFDAPNAKASSSQDRLQSRPGLMETRHLLGRLDWLASVMTSLHEQSKKLVVLRGPTGIGKSSELHRIAHHFLAVEPRPLLVFCVLPDIEQHSEPEDALDQLLGSLLIEIGPPDAAMAAGTLYQRIAYTLHSLERMSRPIIVLVDNAEQLLTASGQVAPCWEDFLIKFLRSRHRTALVLTTKEWPGWSQGEGTFVSERTIPSFTEEDSVALLQNQGLATVPVEYLQQASAIAGGIPLCLEWIATLVKKPLWLDAWDDLDDLSDDEESQAGAVLTRRLLRLLDDPALFRGEMTDRLTPLLDRILAQRLSTEATAVLRVLSLATVPLGTLPLQRLCPRPSLLKELRRVSLLTAHQQRVQVLPTVATLMRSRLEDEQRRQMEAQLIDVYRYWIDNDEEMSDRERGMIIAELAMLYSLQHRLLAAADLLIAYGWMCFNIGYGPRLGRFAEKIMQQFGWKNTAENECGGLLLRDVLTTFLGKAIDTEQQAKDFQHILMLVDEGRLVLQATTQIHPMRILMLYHMNHRRFEEAQVVLEAGKAGLAPLQQARLEVQASLLAQRAWLLAKWGNHLEEQRAEESAFFMREEAIVLYQQCYTLLVNATELSPLKSRLLKKRLSAYSNYLGEYLARNGRTEEALPFLEKSIELGEQGYCNFGALAAAYGDMSQALMELGRFEEALFFDEKAIAEAQRCADSGDALSQDEVWIYRVNRGRLYLRLGRIDEAEQLLQEAEPRIHDRRSVYRMLARRALDEIKQQRERVTFQQKMAVDPD